MDEQHIPLDANRSERLPTLRDIATPIFRHPKLVVVTFLSILLITVVAILLVPKGYQAKMKILVKHDRADEAVSPGRDAVISNPGGVTEEEINSEVELLKSRDLLEKVVSICGLQTTLPGHIWQRLLGGPTIDIDEKQDNDRNLSRAVASLEEKLQIEPLKKTDLIQVTYESPDPELAARVLRTLGNVYLEKTVAVHRPPGAFEFFQAESQHYDQELQAAQAQLAKFDREKGVSDPQIEKQFALQKLSEFEATYNATEVAIKEAENRAHVVQGQLGSTPEQTVSQVRISENQPLIQQLKTTLLDLELKRTALLKNFKPEYGPVQELQQQIDQTRETIKQAEQTPDREETEDRNPSYEWLRSELTKSNAELASLNARASETLHVITQYRKMLGMIDVDGAEQENLVREVKEAESNELLYKQKREEARIGDALDRQRIVNVAIAEAATVPALPAHPPWALTLLLGFLLACLVSPGVAFAADYFDPSLRTPDEVRDVLQIPVLASLPKEKDQRYVS
jgi:protein tyrosine kinase modulator